MLTNIPTFPPQNSHIYHIIKYRIDIGRQLPTLSEWITLFSEKEENKYCGQYILLQSAVTKIVQGTGFCYCEIS